MRIYEIKYRTFEEPTEEEVLELDLKEGDVKIYEDIFHLGAHSLVDAVGMALDYLDTMFDGEYDLVSTSELKGVNVVNWPDQHEGDCDCAFCKAENAPDEDTLQFSCTCDQEIRVMATGWEKIYCPKCSREISRDKILGTNGHYFLVDENKKE